MDLNFACIMRDLIRVFWLDDMSMGHGNFFAEGLCLLLYAVHGTSTSRIHLLYLKPFHPSLFAEAI